MLILHVVREDYEQLQEEVEDEEEEHKPQKLRLQAIWGINTGMEMVTILV